MEITLVGYGNQGRAWAANLRDSGWKVTVSGRADGKGKIEAQKAGFAVLEPFKLKALRGPIAILLPDESVSPFYAQYLAGGEGRQFLFAHGFAVTFGNLPFSPSDDVILVGVKGIGAKLRENFVAGSGVMGVLDVRQNASGKAWDLAEAVSKGLGLDRVGLLRSTFEQETKTDLLSEQVILCGAVPRLVEETVEFLVEKGIDRKLATYECLNELKLIVDMMVEFGVDGMLDRVSNAAYFGGQKAADQILPKSELRARTEKLWSAIEDGSFAKSLESFRRKK
jgi:ketol-acid reductoisomerase